MTNYYPLSSLSVNNLKNIILQYNKLQDYYQYLQTFTISDNKDSLIEFIRNNIYDYQWKNNENYQEDQDDFTEWQVSNCIII